VTLPVHIILNPAAGSGSGRRNRPEVERELARHGVRFTVEETRGRGHALELAALAAERGLGTVVAAGGDGTIHEVVNGLVQWSDRRGAPVPTLGIIPIGTGNDFVKSVTGGTDRQLAYRTIAGGEVRYFDLGRVTWPQGVEYFTNGVGTGIDVEVVRQIMRLPRLPGVVSYLVGLFKALRRFRPLPLRILVDGEEVERRVMIAAVGNGFCLAGGFHLFPGARPDDGELDLCVIEELNLRGIATVVPRVLRGRHGDHPRVTMRRGGVIEIMAQGEDPLFFQIDGELREPPNARRLEVDIIPGVLPVLAAPAQKIS
jgi:YegS/Rv2252/BmrU family lipid kinase